MNGKNRGIRLGVGKINGQTRYRTRLGRELSYTLLNGLSREWLDVYVAWHKANARPKQAASLRRAWLAADK